MFEIIIKYLFVDAMCNLFDLVDAVVICWMKYLQIAQLHAVKDLILPSHSIFIFVANFN
jgi:hypothetical protein